MDFTYGSGQDLNQIRNCSVKMWEPSHKSSDINAQKYTIDSTLQMQHCKFHISQYSVAVQNPLGQRMLRYTK